MPVCESGDSNLCNRENPFKIHPKEPQCVSFANFHGEINDLRIISKCEPGRRDTLMLFFLHVPPQFPRHVSSENMCVYVCLNRQKIWINFFPVQVRCFVLVRPEKPSRTIFDIRTGLLVIFSGKIMFNLIFFYLLSCHCTFNTCSFLLKWKLPRANYLDTFVEMPIRLLCCQSLYSPTLFTVI